MNEIKIATILDLIKHHNQVGYELLYQHHYKLLFTTAFAVTNNEEDSKDVVQNVVYKLAKMPIEKFPNTGEVSWLYRVVKNEAINYAKHKKSHDSLEDTVEIPVLDQEIGELFHRAEYDSLIRDLSDNQKEVVTLKVLGEFSHKEIAKILDKPIGTVQWIYNTSMKQLRVTLATMATCMVVLILGIAARVYTLYHKLMPEVNLEPPMSGESPMGFDSPTMMPMVVEDSLYHSLLQDQVFATLAIVSFVIAIAFIMLWNYSDQLPTKQRSKIV